MLVIAHAGHWAVQLLYIAPLAALLVLIGRDKLRQRSGQRSAPDADRDRPDAER